MSFAVIHKCVNNMYLLYSETWTYFPHMQSLTYLHIFLASFHSTLPSATTFSSQSISCLSFSLHTT